MGVRLAATTPTACDDAVIRILVAIELSKKSWIVGANMPQGHNRTIAESPDRCRRIVGRTNNW